MTKKLYVHNDDYVIGMSLKDTRVLEENNMALHTGGDKEAIIQNRRQLATSLHTSLHTFVCANQTHSDRFYKVTEKDKGRGAWTMDNAIPSTDALYTYEQNVVLCSFTADCVPVLFYHTESGVIGAIHSGWQGTIKGITEKLLFHLIEQENHDPLGFHVFIGMALSQEKFEVDADVYEKFAALGYADDFIDYNDKTDKYHIDNQLTVKRQCELLGIPEDNISLDRHCTFMSKDGFSYREDKHSGRHVSFIMKK